jgi:DHA1 family bicyclomycin/chloramphenicol resistance-like MFS transporter
LIVVCGAIAFQETLQESSGGNIGHTMGRLGVVLKNPGFTTLLVIFSMTGIAFMAFISSSSYIYQNTFRLSSQTYSYFFALNAGGMLAGPLIYLWLAERFKRFSIINAGFAFMIISGVLICALGRLGPWQFAFGLLPATVMGSCMRPPSTVLMLDQQEGDTGSAASLMGSFGTVMGSVGMIIISFNPGNLVHAVGALNVILGLLCGGLWLGVTRLPILNGAREA